MPDRHAIAAEALTWVGTPFVHQGHLKGVGCDCAGLVRGVMLHFGLIQPSDWRGFEGYPKRPNGSLRSACDQFLVPVQTPGIGDVLLMDMGHGEPHHLAFVVPYAPGGLAVVHAMNNRKEVRVHRLSPELQAKVVAAYRLPGVAA